MSENIPSQNEEPIGKCKALYLGTCVFNPENKKINESNLNLSQLQNTIAERYPIDGSNYAQGIQTWLTIFPSGLQMEHASSKDSCSISALFYYPIKSLVYCGALRFIVDLEHVDKNQRNWKFVPLDTEMAQKNQNCRNPPLFVVFLKAIDPNTKKQVVECQVFVIGMIKIAMKLIESCQKAFNSTRESINDFYKKFGNIPVVYCMRTDLDNGDKRVLVKKFDQSGYFYATENTPIDLWQLFEEDQNLYESAMKTKRHVDTHGPIEQIYSEIRPKKKEKNKMSALVKHKTEYIEESNDKANKVDKENEKIVDPYEKTDNLLKVEKRVDPVTGQNIYVRYLAEPNSSSNKTYDLPEKIYDADSDHNSDGETKKNRVFVRQDKTPSPIIVEKYVKKKAPQVIIKEIHVHEPAPPPVKIIQSMDNQYGQNHPPVTDGDFDSNRPPNILGPMAQMYHGPCSAPRPAKGPVIKLVNPNNIPVNGYNSGYNNNNSCYTDVKNLLNKAYGHNFADNQYRDRYQINSLNRNNDMRKNADIEYRKLANHDIYDYNLKPKRLFNDKPTYARNYATIRPDNVKRYSTSYPGHEIYDKYNTTRPVPSRKIYNEIDKKYSANNASNRYRSQDYKDYGSRAPDRNQSTGRHNSRNLAQYNY